MDARGGGGPPGRARLDLAGLNRVLVVNAGSTNLKLSVVDNDDESEDVRSVDRLPSDVDGVAHRVVHGGGSFRGPVVIDDRVEDRDVGEVRQGLLRLLERAQRRRVVQRRERLERRDLRTHHVIDQYRLTKPCAAVHDSMRDRRNVLGEGFDLSRFLALDEVQLQARRAGVDDEDV